MSDYAECDWCRGRGCMTCGWWGLVLLRESSPLDTYPLELRSSWSASPETLAALSGTTAAEPVENKGAPDG